MGHVGGVVGVGVVMMTVGGPGGQVRRCRWGLGLVVPTWSPGFGVGGRTRPSTSSTGRRRRRRHLHDVPSSQAHVRRHPHDVLQSAADLGILVGRFPLTDAKGNPLCAAVLPPLTGWSPGLVPLGLSVRDRQHGRSQRPRLEVASSVCVGQLHWPCVGLPYARLLGVNPSVAKVQREGARVAPPCGCCTCRRCVVPHKIVPINDKPPT
jgi:hypothetical protein